MSYLPIAEELAHLPHASHQPITKKIKKNRRSKRTDSPVVTYMLPLEEIQVRYGKPGESPGSAISECFPAKKKL